MGSKLLNFVNRLYFQGVSSGGGIYGSYGWSMVGVGVFSPLETVKLISSPYSREKSLPGDLVCPIFRKLEERFLLTFLFKQYFRPQHSVIFVYISIVAPNWRGDVNYSHGAGVSPISATAAAYSIVQFIYYIFIGDMEIELSLERNM